MIHFRSFFFKKDDRPRKSSGSKLRRAKPALQQLEDRCTPAGLSSQAIVTQAYQDLLLREVDSSGLATWGNFIDQGNSAAMAAMGIETATSQEWNEVQLNALYSTYLGRAPGAGDAATWLGFLSSGGTYHQMVMWISSSDEAFQAAGSSNDAWLGSLFTNALGRSLDSDTQTQLDNLFAAGMNRVQISAIVLNTPEYYAHLVQDSYQQLLGRPADDASLVFQVNALQAGFTYQDLLAGIVGSPEYAAQSSNATTTSVSTSSDSSTFSESVTFTASVTATIAGAGTPSGTVTFLDNGTALGTGAIDANGQAIFSTASLTPGAHTITATYNGDSTFETSSGTTSLTVNAANTTTALSSSASETVAGQSVNLTAVVSLQSPGSGFASGSVTFTDQTSGTALGTSTLNAVTGVATLDVSTLTVGSHTIVASYTPDGQGNFNASTSDPLTLVIDQSNTTVTASSSLTPSVFGQQVTFTATVTATAPGAGTPSGTVTFTDTTTSTTLGTVDLTSGTATINVSTLTVGSHTIQATYNGDTSFSTNSGSTTQEVTQSAATVSVVSSAPSSVFGQSVILTTTVAATSPGAGTPMGTVTFLDEANNTLGTATLDDSGTASISVSSFAVGDHVITVQYSGDANFATGTGTANQTVGQSASAIVLSSSSNPSNSGASITFTATVSAAAPGSGTPTGTVTFVDQTTNTTLGSATLDGTGQAILTTADLVAIETHTIVATYAGDTNFTLSTGNLEQEIT